LDLPFIYHRIKAAKKTGSNKIVQNFNYIIGCFFLLSTIISLMRIMPPTISDNNSIESFHLYLSSCWFLTHLQTPPYFGLKINSMRIQSYDIIPGLRPYVKLICTMDFDQNTDTSHIRVLPDTCVELFVNYTNTPVAIIGNELHKRSIVSFRMSRHMDVQMRKGAGCLAICFQPGMAYKFFHLPMHVLTDTTATLSDIWNGLAEELEDKLACANNNETRVSIVQNYLLQQLAWDKNDLQVAYCLQQVQLTGGLVSVSKLTSDVGISQRHLLRKFQQCIGLSPKEYLRVYRFIQSLHHIKKFPILSLTEVAYKSGYYDQAHFNRDYKTYTGYAPGELVRAQHIPY
jgi:AraC-like DNA-binding protein